MAWQGMAMALDGKNPPFCLSSRNNLAIVCCIHRYTLSWSRNYGARTARFRSLSLRSEPMSPLKILLIDNYDSYTFNLYQLLAESNGAPPVVIRNDEISWNDLYQRVQNKEFDNVVISPGPGTPAHEADVGLCLPLLRECPNLPILGVCLGHQALGFVHGASVVHAPEPVHGRVFEVSHTGHELLKDVPSGKGNGFEVVRYHSLVVDEATLPADLQAIAWTVPQGSEAPVLMGLAHASRPHFGVQFHPESICSTHGPSLLSNFLDITRRHVAMPPPSGGAPHPPAAVGSATSTGALEECRPSEGAGVEREEPAVAPETQVWWRKLEGVRAKSEALFWGLFGGQADSEAATDTFWLDSAITAEGRPRFSYMGGRGGPLWRRITYELPSPSHAGAGSPGLGGGTLLIEDAAGNVSKHPPDEGFISFLGQQLALHKCRSALDPHPCSSTARVSAPLKAKRRQWDPSLFAVALVSAHVSSSTPDAAFFFADRLLAVDHDTQDVWLVGLARRGNEEHGGLIKEWLEDTEATVRAVLADSAPATKKQKTATGADGALPGSASAGEARGSSQRDGIAQSGGKIKFDAARDEVAYVEDVKQCLEYITEGETYEVCLTNRLKAEARLSPKQLYSTLRRVNPAPYAAWLDLRLPAREGVGSTPSDGERLVVVCSSPERFLRLDSDGWLEAKPIKGTTARALDDPEEDAARAEALRTCVKERAENLMIVDLLRNDMGRVCTVGSVHVPKLMSVESFATVHQLVSTIRGKPDEAVAPTECVRAAFPGGSMTGAPKIRTMDIIEKIEGSARGVYSGSIGYFSVNGTFDLNIVIRSAVLHRGQIMIGAGGAVTILSDPVAEHEEMLLKAERLMTAINAC
ncbi:hypothetical protein CYMTET_32973 [Cymbomonas tetramitiformis]|uniref:aminodeoxychorismate synthase n=1 Tax=Cymbomonas tetramitiformis TaxID=36881 RepID=A0AAE0FE79_9CHLO|nr:hypothetical protein CYMTET_32973 [Cymbomonas tetramitiformis]